mmetsp:Transcript_24605/g.58386  ORF Transcript_24605/g.58386 Transcript_24605/m.58386 type:complete len:206 (-) Transcript_24605:7097-7714(-)
MRGQGGCGQTGAEGPVPGTVGHLHRPQGQQQRLVAADAGERRRAGVAGPGGDAAARPAGAADQDWVLEPPAGGYGGEHVPNHPQLRVQGGLVRHGPDHGDPRLAAAALRHFAVQPGHRYFARCAGAEGVGGEGPGAAAAGSRQQAADDAGLTASAHHRIQDARVAAGAPDRRRCPERLPEVPAMALRRSFCRLARPSWPLGEALV